MKINSIGIIGYGRLGAALSFALHKKGYKVFVYSINIEKKLIPSKYFLNSLEQLINISDTVFICVPDQNIEQVSLNVSNLNNIAGKIFFHTSGAKTSDSLILLKKKNAFIASFHPMQTFPYPIASLKIWQNIYCTLEGDKKAISKAIQICKKLNCKYLILSKQDKLFYHSAAVVASNFLVLLLDMSQRLSLFAGIDPQTYTNLYMPLIKATIKNIEKTGCKKSLSGPLVRNDYDTLLNEIRKISEKNKLISQIFEAFLQYYKNIFNDPEK